MENPCAPCEEQNLNDFTFFSLCFGHKQGMLKLIRSLPPFRLFNAKIFPFASLFLKKQDSEVFINKHFESSQKLRKVGIGIWENFIRNMLSNLKLCYLN